MKKLLSTLAIIFVSLSVSAQSGDGAIWGWLDKLYILKVGLPAIAIYLYYRGWRQSKSGSLESHNGATRDSDINVPFWKCSATIGAYIVTLATIGFFIWNYWEK